MLTTYENNVYDITDFIESHPVVNKKLFSCEWTVRTLLEFYKQHYKPEVFDLLENYKKVGELSDYDPEKYSYLKDEYSNEQKGLSF